MKAVYTSENAIGFEISEKDLRATIKALKRTYDLAEQRQGDDTGGAFALVAALISGLENALAD